MDRQFVALRGLAILIVVIHHSIDMGTLGPQGLGYPPLEGWERHVLLVLHRLGVLAVPTFLFISGYFAAYAARGHSRKLPWKLVGATLKRVLPPYVFWSIVFYLLIYFQRGESYAFLGYLKNLIVGYPFHFIPILVLNYLLAPVVARGSRRYSHVLVVAIAAYQMFLINVRQPGMLGFAFPDWARFLVPPVFGYTLAQWGIYFPLGMIYSLNSRRMLPWLHRFRWPLLLVAVACFLVLIPPLSSVLRWRWAEYVCPLMFLLLSPSIKRDSIPLVRRLEEINRKSYGLYLTHLMVLHLAFSLVQALVPWLLNHQVVLHPFLFLLALGVPLLLMSAVARSPARAVYHALFG